MKRAVECTVQNEQCENRALKNCRKQVCGNCSCDCKVHLAQAWSQYLQTAKRRAIQDNEAEKTVLRIINPRGHTQVHAMNADISVTFR